MMTPPSNTPPNGDFAAYVERLTAPKAGVELREDLFGSKGGNAASKPTAPSTRFAASSGVPSVKPGLPRPFKQMAFLRHVKWLFFLAIALQVLGSFIPGTGFLLLPVLVLYAAWVVFTLKRKSPGGFLEPLREFAARAAEEAKKAQSSQQKKKP